MSDILKNLGGYLLERLNDRSTWATIIGTASTLTGIAFAPEAQEAITAAGASITAMVLVLLKDGAVIKTKSAE